MNKSNEDAMKRIFDIHMQPTERNTQVLTKPYTYNGITIPAGFESNGEDSPVWSWPLGFPPFKPLYAPAYFMHDYILDPENTGSIVWDNVDEANDKWAEIMLKVDPSKKVKWAIKCMYAYWWARRLLRAMEGSL